MTMREVAAEVGCSPATLYQYFPGKQELLAAIFEKHTRAILALLEKALAQAEEPVEKLRRLIRCSLTYFREHRSVAHLFYVNLPRQPGSEMPPLPVSLKESWERLWHHEVELIRRGQAAGRIRQDFPAEEIHRFMRRFVGGIFESFCFEEPPRSEDEQFHVAWGFLAGGMGIRDD
jgi:AcrR family transcriptional regulator